MTTADLAATIRTVKAQVTVPVTYADVWEYWLNNREVYDAVDFVTIHILPYWEDFPIRAKFAADHVDAIRKRMAVAFPGKEILIGETGWPSEGRMREGALPSRTNQARVVSEILDLAKREGFRVNLIEAYDQPWKRELEGTVGGYWGLFDSVRRMLKYPPGEPISNFPLWKLQMGGGMGLSVVVFAVAFLTLRRRPWTPRPAAWIAVALCATTAGILFGVAADKLYYESYGFGGWLLWGALLLAGIASPVLAANALVSGRPLPTSWSCSVRARAGPAPHCHRPRRGAGGDHPDRLETALGFVFDPRYKDFPFASLTMAAVPFAALMLLNRPQAGPRPIAEAVFAGCWPCRRSISASTKAPTTGSRCGPARSMGCLRLRCGRRGSRKSQNEQADRDPRQRDIVEHDTESGGDQPERQQHDRGPDQVQGGDDERDRAEYRIAEQRGCQHPRLAQHGRQAGIAGQRHWGKLDREIAQIERIADGDEADHQQELHLIGRQPKRVLFHRGNMVGNAGGTTRRCSVKRGCQTNRHENMNPSY